MTTSKGNWLCASCFRWKMPTDAPVVLLLQRWFPEWEPPKHTSAKWQATKCPFHGDEMASASISRQLNAFNCFACGVKGDLVKLIREREGLTYSAAKRLAEEVSSGSDTNVSDPVQRKSGRRLFENPGPGHRPPTSTGPDRPVHAGVRRRPPPWA